MIRAHYLYWIREKYVTRTEYDEVKARVDYLENTLLRLVPGFVTSYGSRGGMASPTMPMGPVPAVDPAQTTIMTPFHAHGGGALSTFRGMPSSTPSARGEPPIPPPGQMPPGPANRSPLAMHRPPPSFIHTAPATPAQRQYARATSTSPTLSSSSRLPDTRAPGSRRASLSLAAITSPYTPDTAPYSQPKNLRAQTPPPLGQRLRKTSARSGPAAETHLRASQYIRSPGAGRALQAQSRAISPHPRRRNQRSQNMQLRTPRCHLAHRRCPWPHTRLGLTRNAIPPTPTLTRKSVRATLTNDTCRQASAWPVGTQSILYFFYIQLVLTVIDGALLKSPYRSSVPVARTYTATLRL